MKIGVYCDENPFESLTTEKIESYLSAAKNDQHEILFFEYSNINLKRKKISGITFQNDFWVRKEFKFPDYIINESNLTVEKLPRSIQELQKDITFNTYGIDYFPQLLNKLKKNEKFDNFLPKYSYLNDIQQLTELFTEFPSFLIKNEFGESVYTIHAHPDGSFEIDDFVEAKTVVRQEAFIHMPDIEGDEHKSIALPNLLDAKLGSLKARVCVILNKENEFVILSKTASVNGEEIEVESYLNERQMNGKYMDFMLSNLATDLAKEIQSFYIQPISEFSFEFILEEDNFVLFDVTTEAPKEVDLHERTNYIFDRINQKEWEDVTNQKISIGMLVGTVKNSGRFRYYNNMRFACAGVSKIKGHDFFFFRPEDINFENKTIYGFYYNKKGTYSRKTYKYPTVIIDRLRRRGTEELQYVYDEFADVPFNNVRDGGSLDKSYIYHTVNQSEKFKELLIPFADVETAEEISSFLERHNKIILKPAVASFGDGIVSIFKQENGMYLVRPGNTEKFDMTEQELLPYLEKYLLECEGVVIQKFIESKTKEGSPFDIRIHVLKNAEAEWKIANIYPRLGAVGAVTSNLSGGGSTTSWMHFFTNQFEEYDYQEVNSVIREFSVQFADFFEEALQAPLNEIAIDIGIDRDTMEFYLFEANVNKPGCRNHILEASFYMVDYAEYLAKQGLMRKYKEKQK